MPVRSCGGPLLLGRSADGLFPLVVSHLAVVTCLGAGRQATLAALRAGASGLAPAQPPSAPPGAFVGAVAGLDAVRLDGVAAGFDCRNNRLAALALEQDGFSDAVAEARERYGAERIGLFVGTSTSGILATEFAWRRRDREGGLP